MQSRALHLPQDNWPFYKGPEGTLAGPWLGQASSRFGGGGRAGGRDLSSCFIPPLHLPAALWSADACRLPSATRCSASPSQAFPSPSRPCWWSPAQLELHFCCCLSWTLPSDPDPQERAPPAGLRDRRKPAQASPHPREHPCPRGPSHGSTGWRGRDFGPRLGSRAHI